MFAALFEEGGIVSTSTIDSTCSQNRSYVWRLPRHCHCLPSTARETKQGMACTCSACSQHGASGNPHVSKPEHHAPGDAAERGHVRKLFLVGVVARLASSLTGVLDGEMRRGRAPARHNAPSQRTGRTPETYPRGASQHWCGHGLHKTKMRGQCSPMHALMQRTQKRAAAVECLARTAS